VALRKGADINVQNRKGNTPLHFCFQFGYGATLGAWHRHLQRPAKPQSTRPWMHTDLVTNTDTPFLCAIHPFAHPPRPPFPARVFVCQVSISSPRGLMRPSRTRMASRATRWRSDDDVLSHCHQAAIYFLMSECPASSQLASLPGDYYWALEGAGRAACAASQHQIDDNSPFSSTCSTYLRRT
jgi:hypothetical protein